MNIFVEKKNLLDFFVGQFNLLFMGQFDFIFESQFDWIF